MSVYITLETPLVDQQCLLAALAELGFGEEEVEVHEQPVALRGYQRSDAHIVIRSEHLPNAHSDIGFRKTEQGYRFIVDTDDVHRGFDDAWRRRLRERYDHHFEQKRRRQDAREQRKSEFERRKRLKAQREHIEEKARKLGYRVETSREGKKVKLVLRRRVYN